MLTLYFSPGASSMAPHIALYEIGVAFDAKPLSFKQRDHSKPQFLAINPEGKVPVLALDDGTVLTEVAAILFYLARRYPQAGLLPEQLEQQAQAISWMSFIASTVHPARQKGIEHARHIYALADRRLGKDDWILGRYSIADIHLFRLYWRFRASLQPQPQEFPHLEALHARMLARPAVQRTLAAESAVGYELPA
jgi:glutathione S-transferase